MKTWIIRAAKEMLTMPLMGAIYLAILFLVSPWVFPGDRNFCFDAYLTCVAVSSAILILPGLADMCFFSGINLTGEPRPK